MGMRNGQRKGWRSVVVTGALVAALAGNPARAMGADAPQYVNDFGIGLGTVLVNILYMPVKVVYATLGGITGGFAFILTGGRLETGKAIWVPSMGGTYVVSPSMLRGEDPIYFSGTTEDDRDRDRDRDGRSDERPHEHGTPRDGY